MLSFMISPITKGVHTSYYPNPSK